MMTSRERVECALNHKQPDMMPLSIGSTSNDQYTKVALQRYAERYNIGPYDDTVTWQTVQTVATPEQIQKEFNADFRMIRPGDRDNPFPDHYNPEDGTVIDAMGVKLKPILYYYDVVERPLSGPITMDDIKNYPWPDPYDPGIRRGVREKALKYYNEGYALVTDFLALGPFEGSLWVRGWEDFLCDFYEEPRLAEALMDHVVEYWMGMLDQMLDEVGDLLSVVCCNDDLGMQDRCLIAPDMYEKYVKKYAKRVYDFVHSKTKAKLLHHSCGSCYDLLPHLIDIGVEVLNPLQVSAAKMDPVALKKNFGKDLCFWGGVDTQTILEHKTPEEIDAEVKRLMEIFGEDGGYFVAPSHNIQATVPPENIHAMWTAANKYRTMWSGK